MRVSKHAFEEFTDINEAFEEFADINEVLQHLPSIKMAWRSNFAITVSASLCLPLCLCFLSVARHLLCFAGSLDSTYSSFCFSVHSV